PDVETNLAIRSANHLKVRFIQQSRFGRKFLEKQHDYLSFNKAALTANTQASAERHANFFIYYLEFFL
ncbi:MAG: hypothetical protein ACR5LC_13000, partial [Symbiopectobacterium sp.]|uniref:hypothetical protein n=1 Tax=Symbiopectobacterium sp. TaxID=2952789 RepID=UPI003F2D590B